MQLHRAADDSAVEPPGRFDVYRRIIHLDDEERAEADAGPSRSVLSLVVDNEQLVETEVDDAVVADLVEAEALLARVQSPYVRYVKPVFDAIVAAVLLVLVSPVLLMAAAAVRASLGGPTLFLQERVGLDGRRFDVIKFRTMHPSRRRAQRPFGGPDRRRTHKHPNDPRLTGVGRFLRSSSLDELPQLFNVVKGDMSLVGPRPELPSIVGRYEPWQHDRHLVRPGVTGLWQVTKRGDGLMHEHIDVDIDYIRSVSLATDLRLLLATVPALLRRGEAW